LVHSGRTADRPAGPLLPEGGGHHLLLTRRTSTETTSYQILGTALLRSSEIIRTYLYCWLIAPLIGAGPLLVYLVNADQLAHSLPGGFFTFLILMFVILFAGPILLLALHTRYRERFAPLRVPAWL
jgi:hypothetical protein